MCKLSECLWKFNGLLACIYQAINRFCCLTGMVINVLLTNHIMCRMLLEKQVISMLLAAY